MSNEIILRPDLLSTEHREEPAWVDAYKQALFFLAGNYAAERIREAQRDANARGQSLSGQEIAKRFVEAASYMTTRIQRTSKTDGYRPCLRCQDKGWVYVGPGRSEEDWEPCDHSATPPGPAKTGGET